MENRPAPHSTETEEVAKKLIEKTKESRVFAFQGKMGVGKTTFIRLIGKALGVVDEITSPTFAIVNEYRIEPSGETVYHFDFYRIRSLREAIETGLEEYLDSGKLCFIEWPEIIAPLLPPDTIFITIEEKTDGKRRITFEN